MNRRLLIFIMLTVAACTDVTTLPKIIRGNWRFLHAVDDSRQYTPDDLNGQEDFVRQLETGCTGITITPGLLTIHHSPAVAKDTFTYNVHTAVSSIGLLQIQRTGHMVNVSVYNDTLELTNGHRVYAFVKAAE